MRLQLGVAQPVLAPAAESHGTIRVPGTSAESLEGAPPSRACAAYTSA